MTPNPECELCGGTGTDPVFFGDCTECWPTRLDAHREELWHARRQQWAIERKAEEADLRSAAHAARLRHEAWRTRHNNAHHPTRKERS